MILFVGRMMGPTMSYTMLLQCSGSDVGVVVVKKSSFPCGKSSNTSFLSGNRNSSGSGSCKWRFSSDRVGSDCGDDMRWR